MRSRRMVMGVVALVVALGTGALHQRPAAAYDLTFRTFQHNVHFTYTGAINSVTQSDDPPLVITAQEICRIQYNNLKSDLMGRGYTVFGFAQVEEGEAPAECGNTDGGIVMVASRGDVTLLTRGAFQQQSGNASYGYVCVNGGAFLYSWNVCGGHTHCCDVATSVAHADALRALGNFFNDRPVMIGGDFNRTPTQSGPTSFYPSFDEVDVNGPEVGKPGGYRGAYTYKRRDGGTWVTPTKKIDYFFSGKIRMTAAFGVAYVPYNQVATYSDHNYVYGWNQM